jgi:hypothetical protein
MMPRLVNNGLTSFEVMFLDDVHGRIRREGVESEYVDIRLDAGDRGIGGLFMSTKVEVYPC